ncbi:MAG TPA: hypothetical protein VMU83_18205, partial [Hanamia sp.]|nr:hypothetical protein [Hanamia sp.]
GIRKHFTYYSSARFFADLVYTVPRFCRSFSQHGTTRDAGIKGYSALDKNQKKWGNLLGSHQGKLAVLFTCEVK